VTSVTSSRSVKGTPKTEGEADTNGTQPIEGSSESISLFKKTAWVLEMEAGPKRRLTVEGGRGRVSFSRGARSMGGEARFYRNESTKVYDAVVSGVVAIYSDRCAVESASSMPLSSAIAEAKKRSPMTTPPPPWEEETF
jgi:hypothetical protein